MTTQFEGTTPTLAEVLERSVSSGLGNVYTALPGRIITYNPAQQSATVLPGVQVENKASGEMEPLPVIGGVPVLFPSGGSFRMVWPLVSDDIVTLFFCSSSIEDFLFSTTPDNTTTSKRRHGLSDAVAIPALRPFSSPLIPVDATALELGSDLAQIAFVPAGRVKLGSSLAIDPIALSTANEANWTQFDAWAASVELILTGLGVPVPIPWVPHTPTGSTKVDGV